MGTNLLFKPVPNGFVLLYKDGVYRQAKLYDRDGYLHAKFGAGYVRMGSDKQTTVPKLMWIDYSMEGETHRSKTGWLRTKPVDQPLREAAE